MDQNLSKAWFYLFVEGVVFVCASFALDQLGYRSEWLLIPLWLFNVIPAIYAGRAARDLGKSAMVYGTLAGLGPPVLIFVLSRLRRSALFGRYDRLQ